MIPLSITNKLGTSNWGGGSRNFTAVFAAYPSEQDCAEAQEACGYHPQGYGWPHGICRVVQPDQRWLATWSCARECD